MLQPKQTPKEKKNTKDATQMKNMRPTGPSSGRIKPSQGSAKNGKPVKKAFLGSLLGGAGGGAGGSMLGGMGKQMLGGMASQALGGLMGGGKSGGGATAQGGQGGEAQAPMQKRKSTDSTPVRTRGMMKKGGKVSKAKNGKSFPDLNKDGKITKADILKGRGVIAKKGMSVKKAQNGAKTKDSTDYFKGRSAHFFAKSYKPGYTGAEARILREVSDDFDKDATRQANKGKKGYDKNGYPLKKKAKTGASVKKCRGGCK